ncbi:MAG: adenylate kinase [Planctomycetes bacterium]|jgi:adenylate kinase|nr:adenylate kinase [Planctomycetota bacterium]
MLNLLIFGPPGAGKGTQAKMLAEKYQLNYFSTGEIFREEMAKGSELGNKVKNIIEQGALVPDEITIAILEERIIEKKEGNGFLLDGFPRTIPQAEALDIFMQKENLKISGVLSLEVHNEEIIKRLILRGQTSGRLDDNEESIKNRLEVYDKQTAPLLEYYQKKGNLLPVNGIGDIDEIQNNLCIEIDKIK